MISQMIILITSIAVAVMAAIQVAKWAWVFICFCHRGFCDTQNNFLAVMVYA